MNLKQKVFKMMDEKGYVLDQDAFKMLGREPNYYTIDTYKREWQNLKWCIENNNYHKDNTSEIYKSHRRYCVRNAEIKKIDQYRWQTIPKVYFEYLREKGIKMV